MLPSLPRPHPPPLLRMATQPLPQLPHPLPQPPTTTRPFPPTLPPHCGPPSPPSPRASNTRDCGHLSPPPSSFLPPPRHSCEGRNLSIAFVPLTPPCIPPQSPPPIENIAPPPPSPCIPLGMHRSVENLILSLPAFLRNASNTPPHA
jgi:hypothetical protein